MALIAARNNLRISLENAVNPASLEVSGKKRPRSVRALPHKSTTAPVFTAQNKSGTLVPTKQPVIHIHKPGVCCPGCLAMELENMSLAELPFRDAFRAWINAHSCYISERSQEDYAQYGNALCEFFEEAILGTFNIGSVRSYQQWRSSANFDAVRDSLCKYRHRAGNVRIKNEINSVLKPMLREVGLWEEIKKKKFKHLPVPREGSGIALPKEQWREIFDIAFGCKRWQLAGHCLRIMFFGGFGFGELRRVRRKEADAAKGTLRIVEGAKNGERERTVALPPSALESLKWLIARWERMGGTNENQYLLPHKATISNKSLDRPMASINFAWNAIKREWVVRRPKQARPETRQYDARVSAASLLLQNKDLSLPTIEKALGWTPSSAMRKRYHRADLEYKREALSTLEDAV